MKSDSLSSEENNEEVGEGISEETGEKLVLIIGYNSIDSIALFALILDFSQK